MVQEMTLRKARGEKGLIIVSRIPNSPIARATTNISVMVTEDRHNIEAMRKENLRDVTRDRTRWRWAYLLFLDPKGRG